jgi:hypothetical protein
MARQTGSIGFVEDIVGFFSQKDRDHMAFMMDLGAWDSVRDNAVGIERETREGRMPPAPDPQWTPDQVQRFSAWINEGMPKHRSSKYAAYFTELDAWTEYWDIYKPETQGRFYNGDGTTPGMLSTIFPLIEKWREYAQFESEPEGPDVLVELQARMADPVVASEFREMEELLDRLVRSHFAIDGTLDVEAFLDAFESFGRDTLPLDHDRDARVPDGDFRKEHAKYHRMDGAGLWFVWAGFLDCASLLENSAAHAKSRLLMMAAITIGCPMDFVFRERSRSRPGYRKDERTVKLLRRRALRFANSWDAAASEARDLFRIHDAGVPG